jgi:hypothetical protein
MEQRAVRGVSSIAYRGLLGLFGGAAVGFFTLTDPHEPPLGGTGVGAILGLAIGLGIGVFVWAVFPYRRAK